MTAEIVVAVLLGCAAVTSDLRTRKIPNRITISAAAAGLALAALHGGWYGLAASIAGAVLGFLFFAFFFWMGGMGGGDVKLMAAFGALLGPSAIVPAAVLAAMAGGLMAIVALLAPRHVRTIPYAPAIVAGAWLALLAQG